MDAIELNVADPASIEEAAKTLITRYPSLNVLVNNAGVMPFDNAGVLLTTSSRSIIDTNLLGPIRLSSALIEH